MGSAFSERVNAWTYRYNQRNPTSGGVGVGHAAENWMMFLGTNTGSDSLCLHLSSVVTLVLIFFPWAQIQRNHDVHQDVAYRNFVRRGTNCVLAFLRTSREPQHVQIGSFTYVAPILEETA